MNHLPLGDTGLYVSTLCLGAMTFGQGDDPMSRVIGSTGLETARAMVDRALEAGINFFDTANGYSYGRSEEILGEAIRSHRDDIVLATKVFFPMKGGINDMGLSRVALRRELEGSLERLGTEWIDLYQVHCFDPTTPLEETLRTLDDLVREGKVRYLGLSNFAAWQIAKADGIAKRYGYEPFRSVQAYYSLVGRELEREILPAAIDLGLGVMVWSPLAGGFLSGKYTRDGAGEGRRLRFDMPPVDVERGYDIVDVLNEIAGETDTTAAAVALAWLLHQEGVTSVILGARTMEQLEANLDAANFALDHTQLERLDEVSRPTPEYPQWFPDLPRGVDMRDLWEAGS